MKSIVNELTITFERDHIEYSVSYIEASPGAKSATPGCKQRTTSAATMAQMALQRAQEYLDKGTPVWGGFATDSVARKSTDRIMIDERRTNAKAS